MNKRIEKKQLKQKQISFLWSIVGSEKRWYIAYLLKQMSPSFQSSFLRSATHKRSRNIIKKDILTQYCKEKVIPESVHCDYLESKEFIDSWKFVEKERKKLSDSNLLNRTFALTNICNQIDVMKRKLFEH